MDPSRRTFASLTVFFSLAVSNFPGIQPSKRAPVFMSAGSWSSFRLYPTKDDRIPIDVFMSVDVMPVFQHA